MKFDPGKCIKCGENTIENGSLKTNHNDVVFQLSDGSKFFVGVCTNCEIDPSEYPELIQAYRTYQVLSGVRVTNDVFIANQITRQAMQDVLLSVQSWQCAKCGKPIGENYVQTNGKIQHESCVMPDKDRIALLAEIEALKAEVSQLKGVQA